MMGFFSDWGWVSWMWLPMVLWWVVVILIVVAIVRWIGGMPRDQGKSARAILDERYARGELSKSEYEEKRRALNV